MSIIKSIEDTETATKLRVLLVPFGSPTKKDFHGEFFDKETYFGLDLGVKDFYAMYDHHFNDVSNPNASPNQIIGKTSYVETDVEGLWYDFEVLKSHAYHDGIVRLAKEGYLGASSGTYPGGKSLDPHVKGRISRWIIGEGSLTVTPAEPDTIGKVYELQKSMPLNLPLPVPVVETLAAAEPEETEPVAAVVQTTTTTEVVVPTIEAEVAAILADDTDSDVAAEVSKAVGDTSLLKMVVETQALVKSIWAMFEVFGGPEEFKESLAAVGEVLNGVRSLDASVKAVASETAGTQAAVKTVAAYIKSVKTVAVTEEVARMGSMEKDAYLRSAAAPTVKARISSKIPDHAPGG